MRVKLNREEVGGAVRSVAAITLGYAVGQGWIDTGTASLLTVFAGAVGMTAWSIWAKRRNASRRKAAAPK